MTIMRPVQRQYLKVFIPAMLAYVVVIFASAFIFKKIGPDAPIYLRAVLSIAPVIPIIFVCRALFRFLRDSDELERKIELEAIAFSSLSTGLIFITLGFLAASNIIYLNGAMVAIFVFPALFGLYGVAKYFTSRRYR